MKLRAVSNIQAMIQGGIFFCVGALFAWIVLYPGVKVDDKVSPLAAATYIIITAFFAGLIGSINAINAARNGWLNKKIELEPAEQQKLKSSSVPRAPLWLVPTLYSIIPLFVFGGLALLICFELFPQGMTLLALLVISALLVGGHTAFVVKMVTSRELFKFVAHPPEKPLAFTSNLVVEHVLGNGIGPLLINGALGYAFFYRLLSAPEPLVPFAPMAIDLAIQSVILSLIVPLGVSLQVSNETRENRVLVPVRHEKSVSGLVVQNLKYLAMGGVCFAVVVAVLYLVGMRTFGLYDLVVIKGVESALVGGFASVMAAYYVAAKISANKDGVSLQTK